MALHAKGKKAKGRWSESRMRGVMGKSLVREIGRPLG